jgi:hypothetical protein
MNERTNERMNERMNERTNERSNERMNERANERTSESNERANRNKTRTMEGFCCIVMYQSIGVLLFSCVYDTGVYYVRYNSIQYLHIVMNVTLFGIRRLSVGHHRSYILEDDRGMYIVNGLRATVELRLYGIDSYAIEVKYLDVLNQYLKSEWGHPFHELLRLRMQNDTETSSCIFAGTEGWENTEWTDDEQQIRILLRRHEKATLYKSQLYPVRWCLGQPSDWPRMEEGMAWIEEIALVKQSIGFQHDEERRRAGYARLVLRKQKEARAQRTKHKRRVSNFFDGVRLHCGNSYFR